MSGIFEQLLAAQLETNKLLGQLVAGGGAAKSTDAADDKAAAGNKTTGNKTTGNKTTKPKGATVAQASAEVTKVRNEKGREAALRALTIGKDTIKLAEINEDNADVIFKQAKAILAEVEEEEEAEEEDEI